MNLPQQVGEAVRTAAAYSGFDPDKDFIVIGVSGGPDSLALLHLLRQFIQAENLIVAYLDHGLRPNSAAESDFVAAASRGLRYQTKKVDVAELARGQGLSIEEAGRMARYDFLARLAHDVGARFIAVGHNADDQVETILMHLLRGSGAAGLIGMQPVSPLTGHSGMWLLRPLLAVPRVEIEAYCREKGLEPVMDESNEDITFLRNRIRHELLPILESYNPQFRRRMLEMSAIVAADEAFMTSAVAQAWEISLRQEEMGRVVMDRDAWRGCSLSLRRRMLRRAIATIDPNGRDVGFRALESARVVAETGETGSRADLPGGIVLLVQYGHLIIQATTADPALSLPQLSDVTEITFPIPGEVGLANGWWITAEWMDSPDLPAIVANKDPWAAYLSLGDTSALIVRPRRRGERMHPLGMPAETKIKEIMINRKIPGYSRARWPVIATMDHAVWIAGHVTDQRARVLPGQTRVVRLHCTRAGEPPAG